jgi:hypothetical protein
MKSPTNIAQGNLIKISIIAQNFHYFTAGTLDTDLFYHIPFTLTGYPRLVIGMSTGRIGFRFGKRNWLKGLIGNSLDSRVEQLSRGCVGFPERAGVKRCKWS